MNTHKLSSKLLTFITLSYTWITLVQSLPMTLQNGRSNTNITHATHDTSHSNVASTGLSSNNNDTTISDSLEMLISAYIKDHVSTVNASSGLHIHPVLQPEPAVLSHEDETEVEDLEKVVQNQTIVFEDIALPPDVYEVPLDVWVRERNAETVAQPAQPATQQTEDSLQEAELLISEIMRSQSTERPPHLIRHRGRRLARRKPQTQQVESTPVENQNNDDSIMTLLGPQETSGEALHRPKVTLKTKAMYNLILYSLNVELHNIRGRKIKRIMDIMNFNCTLTTKAYHMWVSKTKGIMFKCPTDGLWRPAWITRRTTKPNPISVTDCHELHLRSLNQGSEEVPNQLVIYYSGKERKPRDVMCKHDATHTNYQLLNNSSNPDPNHPVLPIGQITAGAWTVIQRRENGQIPFYRPLEQYESGFGSVSREYWIGLNALHEATNIRSYMLRVEITTADNITYFSEYTKFRVGNKTKNYRLKLGEYIKPTNTTFSSGDLLSFHDGGKFHAKDSEHYSENCAKKYATAFWFKDCMASININGPYANNTGVEWAVAKPYEVIRVWKTEMMIKPILGQN